MENNVMLQFKQVSFGYHFEDEPVDRPVLHAFDLTVYPGEFVAVLGRNGSGKSTIAKLANGILIPDSGTVTVNGLSTADENNHREIRKTCGLVFQNPDNQIVATIVEEDVAFGPENLGVPPAEIRERVDRALKSVGMYDARKKEPHKLSGGQKQRIAIAGVLAMNPKCIILDEATAMLDPHGRREVMETVLRLNRDYGITILYITHYMEEAAMANRIIVMDQGHSVMDGSPSEVFSRVTEMKRLGLDVPQVTELMDGLAQCGLVVQSNILDVESCVQELARLLEGK